MPLIQRLKERALFQWGAAYVAGAWLLLEILGFLTETFFWPPAIVRGFTVALAVGLIIALVLAWYHGEKGRQRVGGAELLILTGLLASGGVLVAVFAPTAAVEAAASPAEVLLPVGEERRRSVAVLPFENLSADAENAFFADGIHESVLTQLSKIGELRVLSRASMMRYRDTRLTLQEIAEELSAGAVLQGSVQRSGDQIRISAQLVDPASGNNLWADQFDGQLEDLFNVQTTVAVEVAESLEAALGPDELEVVSRPATENLDALDFYLRGRQVYLRRTLDDNEEAIRLFQLAIEEDASFALAWSSLGDAYLRRSGVFGYPIEWADSAVAAGNRAIALDSTLAEGYATLGGADFTLGHNAAAAGWYRRALELNPTLQSAVSNHALANLFTGNWAEALRWSKRAFRLEPTSARVRELLANSYQDLREFGIAERWLEEALVRDPRSPLVRRQQQALEILRGEPEVGYRTFVRYLDETGDEDPYLSTVAANGAHYARAFDEVLEWSREALDQASGGALRDYHDVRVIRAFALSRDGLTPEALELLESAEREYSQPLQVGADSWVFPLFLSAIHLVRGSTEEGLDWLLRADAAGFNGWNLLEQDPIYDEVREEPRYREVIAEMRGRLEAQRSAIELEERASGDRP